MGADACHQEGASESLDIAGTKIEEDEKNIEMWAMDEDDADHAAPLPSTSTTATCCHNQDDSNLPPPKVQKTRTSKNAKGGS